MSQRVDPNLLNELKDYGAVGVEKCFNCGNCTAICPLTDDDHLFPRDMIRYAQLGLKESMITSPDPWLCYYCGECSTTCPKEAEPGETMMALRRWVTAQYDWTGLGALFYTSNTWSIAGLLIIAAFVITVFALFHGPIVTDQVQLNTFAPVHIIHIADLGMAAIITLYLLISVYRMYTFIIRRGTDIKIPIWIFITEAWRLPYQFLTQQKFSKCEDKRPWINHLILVSGYILMFGIIVIFLNWFQTDNVYPIYNPQRWLGYYAAGALIYGAGIAIWGRFRKNRELHKHSTLSDWLFPILLVSLAVSGLLVHIFRYAGLPLATYYTYVIHLIFVPSIYFVIGPMGKWGHLFYRPLAIYFDQVKQRALERSRSIEAATAPAM